MTRIESRPSHKRKWTTCSSSTSTGTRTTSRWRRRWRTLKKRASLFRVLGVVSSRSRLTVSQTTPVEHLDLAPIRRVRAARCGCPARRAFRIASCCWQRWRRDDAHHRSAGVGRHARTCSKRCARWASKCSGPAARGHGETMVASATGQADTGGLADRGRRRRLPAFAAPTCSLATAGTAYPPTNRRARLRRRRIQARRPPAHA